MTVVFLEQSINGIYVKTVPNNASRPPPCVPVGPLVGLCTAVHDFHSHCVGGQ